MQYTRHYELGFYGEVITNAAGATCGSPSIRVSVELPANVQWEHEQEKQFSKLFEEVRELVQSAQNQK